MRLFKHTTNIDFLGFKWKAIAITLALAAIGTASLVSKRGPKLGIDFTGGAQVILGFAERPDDSNLRKVVEKAGLPVVSVQRFDSPEKNQLLVRIPMENREGRDPGTEVTNALTKALFPRGLTSFDLNLKGVDAIKTKLEEADPERYATRPGVDPRVEYRRIAEMLVQARSQNGLFRSMDAAAAVEGLSPAVKEWLTTKTVAGPFVLLSADNVGPQIGKDLRSKGMWAVIGSWAAMLAYIAFRFRSLSFGTAAVIALVHDTWITLGACSLYGVEIGLTEVAAFLTLIGYSVNDTVVVFDRIRENVSKKTNETLAQVTNRSLNETLSRTMLTSALTFVVSVILLVMGGQALHAFAFILVVGIIVGTISSVYVAAPLVVIWEDWKTARGAGSRRSRSVNVAVLGLLLLGATAGCGPRTPHHLPYLPLASLDASYGTLVAVGNHPTPDQYGTGERIGIFRAPDGTLWGLPIVPRDAGDLGVCSSPLLAGAPVTDVIPTVATELQLLGTTNEPTGWRGGTGKLELVFRDRAGGVHWIPVTGKEMPKNVDCWAPSSPGPAQRLHYYRLRGTER